MRYCYKLSLVEFMAIQWQLSLLEISVFKFIRLRKQCTVTRNRNDSWPLW